MWVEGWGSTYVCMFEQQGADHLPEKLLIVQLHRCEESQLSFFLMNLSEITNILKTSLCCVYLAGCVHYNRGMSLEPTADFRAYPPISPDMDWHVPHTDVWSVLQCTYNSAINWKVTGILDTNARLVITDILPSMLVGNLLYSNTNSNNESTWAHRLKKFIRQFN